MIQPHERVSESAGREVRTDCNFFSRFVQQIFFLVLPPKDNDLKTR